MVARNKYDIRKVFDFIESFWENYSFFFHTVGFVTTIIFFVGLSWGKWQAQAADIDDLKSRMTKQEMTSVQILQSVRDIKDDVQDIKGYFHIAPRRQP